MKSMTAYARADAQLSIGGPDASITREISVEMRAVNSRYLDLSVKLPRSLIGLEDRVKVLLTGAGISRGKLDLTVTQTIREAVADSSAVPLEPDLLFAGRLVEAAKKLSCELDIPNDLTVSRLMTMPGVLVPVKAEGDDSIETAWEQLEPVLETAVGQFLAAREREGERLAEDMRGKIARIRELTVALAAGSEADISTLRERFEERLRSLIGQSGIRPDESRVITECAIFADRLSIDEELVRLASHLDTLESLLSEAVAVGRKLDFMLQETNREINTIGSKCANADMARLVAEVKNELEKLREQAQNIE